jgi:hypothetical protein
MPVDEPRTGARNIAEIRPKTNPVIDRIAASHIMLAVI